MCWELWSVEPKSLIFKLKFNCACVISTCLFDFTKQNGILSELILWLCENVFGSFKVRWIRFLSPTAAQVAAKRKDTAEGKTAHKEGWFVKANHQGEGQEEGSCVKGGRRGEVRGSMKDNGKILSSPDSTLSQGKMVWTELNFLDYSCDNVKHSEHLLKEGTSSD